MFLNSRPGPCMGCEPPKRTPTCKFDGSCNKYTDWKARDEANKEKHRDEWLRDSQYQQMVGEKLFAHTGNYRKRWRR